MNPRTLASGGLIGFLTVFQCTASLTVTSLADSGPGSLRDRVAASVPGDSIVFSVTGTILLSSAININHTLYVQGPGPSALTMDANHVDRAFITAGNPVFLSGMTISNGFAAGPNGLDGGLGQNGSPGVNAQGGAIYDTGTSLILSNCWFEGNTAQGGRGGRGGDNLIGAVFTPGSGGNGGTGDGGALFSPGIITMFNCTFSHNRALGGNGGAGGTNFNITAMPGGAGGKGGAGIGGGFDSSQNVNITNATFSGNEVFAGSGGKGGDAMVVSGGQGGDGGISFGGGIACLVASFRSCTIVSNSAFAGTAGLGGNGSPPGPTGTPGTGQAGGIYGYTIVCLCKIGNSIVADNYADTIYTNYYIAFDDVGYNYIGSEDFVNCPFGSTTQVGSVASPLHPQLRPLAQNGSGLPTHKPVYPGSPVIDAGQSFGITTDERGAPRPYDFPSLPNAAGGDGSDIGALELGLPDLGMGSSGSGGVVISWPAGYGDFILECTTNLSASNNWIVVSNLPVVIGNQLTVTNIVTGPIKLFRLISQ
jgi:hypothetical protein